MENVDALDAELGGFVDDGFDRNAFGAEVPVGIGGDTEFDAFTERGRGSGSGGLGVGGEGGGGEGTQSEEIAAVERGRHVHDGRRVFLNRAVSKPGAAGPVRSRFRGGQSRSAWRWERIKTLVVGCWGVP